MPVNWKLVGAGLTIIGILLGIPRVRCSLSLEAGEACKFNEYVDVNLRVIEESPESPGGYKPSAGTHVILISNNVAQSGDLTDGQGNLSVKVSPKNPVRIEISKAGFDFFSETINSKALPPNAKILVLKRQVSTDSLPNQYPPNTPTRGTPTPPGLGLEERLIGTWYFEGVELGRQKKLCLRLKQDNNFDSVFSNPDPEFEPGIWRIDYEDDFPSLHLYTSPRLYATYQILSIEDNGNFLKSRLTKSPDPISQRDQPLRDFRREQCMSAPPSPP